MVLSSAISATQNQRDYLSVLADAIRRYGAPEAIVTDGGGIFYSTVALQLYNMLGIRKERIDPGTPWQNYAETLFSIQKRLGDHAFFNRLFAWTSNSSMCSIASWNWSACSVLRLRKRLDKIFPQVYSLLSNY